MTLLSITIALAQKSVLDNIPCVTATATAEDVVAHGNMFRATVTDPFQGVVLAEFAKKQGYQRVGTIFNSGGVTKLMATHLFRELVSWALRLYPAGTIQQELLTLRPAPPALLDPDAVWLKLLPRITARL